MTLRRGIGIIAAAAMLTVCSVSCGDSDDEEGSGSDSPKDSYTNTDPFNSFDKGGAGIGYPEGSYAKIEPIGNYNYTDYESSIDAGIKQAIESYRSLEAKPLTFTGERFEIKAQTWFDEINTFSNSPNEPSCTYSGTFTVENGKILLSYENFHSDTSNYDINVNDELPKRNNVQDYMRELNETGSYFTKVTPRIYTFDKNISYITLPYFAEYSGGTIKREGENFILSVVGDFICAPTYGFWLNGSYSRGSDFTIDYNMLSSYLDDPYSVYSLNGRDYRDQIEHFFGDLKDTQIEFSNGKWTWTNSEGDIINNGTYLESRQYRGLIGMFIDKNSKQAQSTSKVNQRSFEQYKKCCPLLFYIAGDGTIWYPGFEKMN